MLKRVLTLIFIVTAFSACDKIDELTKFEIDYESKVVVPATIAINSPIDIFTPDITTNSEATFESNNTHKDLIEEIRLTQLKLEVIVPDGEDLSFLEKVSIYINADGLSEKKIAWNDDVSATAGPIIELEVSPDDIKEYIKKDEFSLKATTTTDELITEDYEIKVLSTFFVDAKILGI